MNRVETYLSELYKVRSSNAGVKEVSYYPALANLLNAIGKTLVPEVRCIMNLRNRGAGMPDGGLFTPDQFASMPENDPSKAPVPARGVIEIKGTADDAWVTAQGEQVSRYWRRYRQVLITNYRDFVMLGQSEDGIPVQLEAFQLAESEGAFWALAQSPEQLSEERANEFVNYLRRAMSETAPLTTPEDVARTLALYAREAKKHIDKAKLPALQHLRTALEEALGIRFEGDQGDKFFRSTLTQTLFYGIFSAWVIWCRQSSQRATSGGSKNRPIFDWRVAHWNLSIPMVKTLLEEVNTPSRLGPLNIMEILDWTGNALNRIDRETFFERFKEEQAIQYFYEPFLQAFDPALRKELGVWYTPPQVARYMVTRVDTMLREKLDCPAGLADPRVIVLDASCGTGTFQIEVLKMIADTLRATGDALWAKDLKDAAMERIFGFEIMPAPFVVAHLQIGLLLQEWGVPLSEKTKQRVAVYLTNALTGWSSTQDGKQISLFPELQAERDAAHAVKVDKPILVMIGNPPYNGFAGVVQTAEERDLVTAYRKAKKTKQPRGQGLNDLYVRFFRMAERRIIENTHKGIVCYITNYSWLDGLSCTAMRERYLEVFDHIWIDSLNGDKFKTGKVTPEGAPDPSIFSTELNREGIQVGTSITLLVREAQHDPTTTIHFRDLWGKTKREELDATAYQEGKSLYQVLAPEIELGYPFMPVQMEGNYLQWPLLSEIFAKGFPGLKTSRDPFVIDIDRDTLLARMQAYFDPSVTDAQMRRMAPVAMKSSGGFKADQVRATLQARGFLPANVVRYAYRPFDTRWLYWEPETELLDRKREDYFPQAFAGNLWIEAREQQPMEDFDRGYFTTVLADNFGNGLSSYYPLFYDPSKDASDAAPAQARQLTLMQVDYDQEAEADVSAEKQGPRLNLTSMARSYLDNVFGLNGADPGSDAVIEAGTALFYYMLSILHAPAYRRANGGALRLDWPRVPLPSEKDVILSAAEAGKQIATLMNTEAAVKGVTTPGTTRTELQSMALIGRVDGSGKPIDPDAGDLRVQANWGYLDQKGAIMPAQGKVIQRPYTPAECKALEQGTVALGMSIEQMLACLGPSTMDVYLNPDVCWKNVPSNVWEYTASGYQPLKKWLSYRETSIMGDC